MYLKLLVLLKREHFFLKLATHQDLNETNVWLYGDFWVSGGFLNF